MDILEAPVEPGTQPPPFKVKVSLNSDVNTRGSLQLDGLRSKARSFSSAKQDPREAYRQQCDPNDPTHENMPLLSAKDSLGDLVPVVLANEQHPTSHELRSGACEVCKHMCKMFGLLAVAFMAAIYLSDEAACGAPFSNATGAPESCVRDTSNYVRGESDPNILDKLLPECNTCGAAQDSECDEGVPGSDGKSSRSLSQGSVQQS